jgi:FMN phosphatase YigB (HAD superfamily)
MITLVAFDLDGTLAESKQPLKEPMGEALANLLAVANVAVRYIGPDTSHQMSRTFVSCICPLFKHVLTSLQ